MHNAKQHLARAAERIQGMERKKLLLACAIVVIVALLVLVIVWIGVIGTQQRPTTTSDIVVRGTVACLPHKDTGGPQTMECALGIRTDDNRYYGLQHVPHALPNTGTPIEVRGTLTQPATTSQYDIVNMISVNSVAAY